MTACARRRSWCVTRRTPKNENTGVVVVTKNNLNDPKVRQFITPRCGPPARSTWVEPRLPAGRSAPGSARRQAVDL